MLQDKENASDFEKFCEQNAIVLMIAISITGYSYLVGLAYFIKYLG